MNTLRMGSESAWRRFRLNANGVKEVKAACRMFVQSDTVRAAFISFNLMLSAVFS